MIAVLVLSALFLSADALFFVLAGLFLSKSRRQGTSTSTDGTESFLLVLIPAHDEGEYLRPTLKNIRGLDYPNDRFRVIVIADNCTDNTAMVAEQEGCEVWERTDTEQRGKGYALSWALDRVKDLAYDGVVIVDADTLGSNNLLRVFDRELKRGHQAIQVLYNFEFPVASPPWLKMVSRAAKHADDIFVSRPRSAFGLYQGLQGTGFCISTKALRLVPWRAHSICEDLEYGFELAKQRIPICFVEDASVTALMTGQVKHASGQRGRWAGGTYGLIARLLPDMFIGGIRKGDWKSVESCTYLCLRSRIPLAALSLLTCIYIAIRWNSFAAIWWILFASALSFQLMYLLAVLLAARKEAPFGRMVLWVLIYLSWMSRRHLGSLLRLRNAKWNRTERG